MTEKEFAANIDNLYDVMDFLESELEKMDASPKSSMQISIAVEEIFVNIAKYAYPNSQGTMKLSIGCDGGDAVICFCDGGIPFDPLKKADPDITLTAEERKIGGLGIYMVKQTMDKLEYIYENGCNILTMTKGI